MMKKSNVKFVVDNRMLVQIIWFGYPIGEASCPTKHFEDASSINFWRSVVYGFGVLKTALQFRLCKRDLLLFRFQTTNVAEQGESHRQPERLPLQSLHFAIHFLLGIHRTAAL
jgi:hypothetical protein